MHPYIPYVIVERAAGPYYVLSLQEVEPVQKVKTQEVFDMLNEVSVTAPAAAAWTLHAP